MLQHLHIKGLALIDELEIDFSKGFNVVTGETGAGKSILIKALSLLFGDKAQPDIIRHGFDETQVVGVFEVAPDHAVLKKLSFVGLNFDEDKSPKEILIRRKVHVKGRSMMWINDVPVSLGVARDISAALMDVFGQHASHGLLNPAYHLKSLDAFLPKPELKKTYRETYDEVLAEYKSLQKTVSDYFKRAGDKDYLAFRLNELSDFNPTTEEYDRLLEICRSSGKLMGKKKHLSQSLDILEGGYKNEAISKGLWTASKSLQGVEKCEGFQGSIEEAARIVDDVSFELRRFFESIDLSEDDIETHQQRLGSYQSLLRRFSLQSVEQLMAKLADLQSELDFLENAKQNMTDAIKKLWTQCQKLEALGKELSLARRTAFKKIKGVIEKELGQLAMPGARLEVEWQPIEHSLEAIHWEGLVDKKSAEQFASVCDIMSSLQADGAEKIHFLLQSNPGEPARALHKIASGGEMSRIMLALKKVLALGAQTCVLVFDEIDTGISGEVADIVGQKLCKLAKQFQIICISHLPQVSVYADAHFLVSKQRGARTQSSISKLSQKESTEELARLLSGDKVTASSLANAKALRAHADQIR